MEILNMYEMRTFSRVQFKNCHFVEKKNVAEMCLKYTFHSFFPPCSLLTLCK